MGFILLNDDDKLSPAFVFDTTSTSDDVLTGSGDDGATILVEVFLLPRG